MVFELIVLNLYYYQIARKSLLVVDDMLSADAVGALGSICLLCSLLRCVNYCGLFLQEIKIDRAH